MWNNPAIQGEIFAKTGETLDQPSLEVLRRLLAWGPMHPTALAKLLGTGPSHVSKIVRELETDGLVQRIAHQSDGRATLVRIQTARNQQQVTAPGWKLTSRFHELGRRRLTK
ncbi:MarR family transcriptional regulator [Streptomyces sp. NPDC014676]|uniref:MarR family transcriptional regulator n=1 Tax=Streptomyces sp. NPDC014676 TaxID=3364879 RepID=UPI0036F7A992